MRDEFRSQLDSLDNNPVDFVEEPDADMDRPNTRAVLSKWIADLDDIIDQMDGNPANVLSKAEAR